MRHSMMIAALAAGLLLSPVALAQDAPGADTRGLGKEEANFGLTPFTTVPTIAFSEEKMAKLRSLEDAQLLARRQMEDKFTQEMRDLLVQQAKDRQALIAELSSSP